MLSVFLSLSGLQSDADNVLYNVDLHVTLASVPRPVSFFSIVLTLSVWYHLANWLQYLLSDSCMCDQVPVQLSDRGGLWIDKCIFAADLQLPPVWTDAGCCPPSPWQGWLPRHHAAACCSFVLWCHKWVNVCCRKVFQLVLLSLSEQTLIITNHNNYTDGHLQTQSIAQWITTLSWGMSE